MTEQERRYILVTGGAGFIGSNLCQFLRQQGFYPLVIDDLSTGLASNIVDKTDFYNIDVGMAGPFKMADLLGNLHRLDIRAVIHLAAQSRIRQGSYTEDIRSNVFGAAQVFELACSLETVTHVVFASSGSVYGEMVDAVAYHETDPTYPISSYGISKLTGENYLRVMADAAGKAWAALRLGNVFGPGQRPELRAGAPTVFLHDLMNGRKPILHNGGVSVRDYVYVGDVVRAFYLATQIKFVDSGIINIAGSLLGQLRTKDVLGKCRRLTGVNAPTVVDKQVEGDASRIVLHTSRAKSVLGWEPLTSFDAGLRATHAWLQSRMEQGEK